VSQIILSELTDYLILWPSNVAGPAGHQLLKFISVWQTRTIIVSYQFCISDAVFHQRRISSCYIRYLASTIQEYIYQEDKNFHRSSSVSAFLDAGFIKELDQVLYQRLFITRVSKGTIYIQVICRLLWL